MKYNINELGLGTLHTHRNDPLKTFEVRDREIGVNPATALIYLVPLGGEYSEGTWYTLIDINLNFLPHVATIDRR
jgi:hypothetical protein